MGIDIPIMGVDYTDENTLSFMEEGQIPEFKLYKESTNEYYDLTSNEIHGFDISNPIQIINTFRLEALPSKINLLNPYPNPFNPTTNIEFVVPEGGKHINISIYDIRGRLVEQLVDNFYEPSNDSYKIKWNAGNVSSGIYFIKLSSGSDIQTRKITLIK